MTKLLYVQGLNGSSAQRLENNKWIVSGAADILGQQEPGENAYRIKATFDDIMKLPFDTPIYASVNSFEVFTQEDKDNGESFHSGHDEMASITEDFETVGDLFDAAKDAIKTVYENLEPSEKKHFRIMNKNSVEAITEVAENIWDNADWASLYTGGDEIANDIQECLSNGEYDAYPALMKE